MGDFVRHEACKACGSSDGKAIYADGSYFCWVCKDVKPSQDHIESSKDTPKVKKATKKELNLDIKPSTKPPITPERWAQIKEETEKTGGDYRGIRDDTYNKFGVRHKFSANDEVIEQYYPITKGGQLVGTKCREVPKDFFSEGQTGADCDLFMQHAFNRPGKYVVITEGECFTPDTKVLTRNGWVSLRDYTNGEVMQADGSFAEPIAIVKKKFEGNLVSYTSGSYSIKTTPEHNMLRLFKGEVVKVKAGDKTKKHLPVPRVVQSSSLTDERGVLMARAQVMFSADFTFREDGDLYGCLKKDRKIIRCREILDSLDVRYSENKDSRGYSSFFIHRGHNLDVSKEFSYQRDLPYSATIIEEVLFWDGNNVPNRNQIEYNTVIQHNAEFVQTCAHINGMVSSLIYRSRDKYNWIKVSILKGKKNSSTQKGYTEESYSGDVMCLTMPNGTLMVKYSDSISVSGNCDALSAYQMLNDYAKSKGHDYEFAVVSATTGANSYKQIAAQYRFLDKFDNIVVSYDNDQAGKNALEELVKILPKGKIKVMNMRYKDANEYLQKDQDRQFVNDFYDAEQYVPIGIVASNTISNDMRKELEIAKIPLPPFMHKLQDMMSGGIPLGRIINLGSASGTGKSTIVDEIIYYMLFNSPHMTGIVTLESTAGQYGIKLLSRHIGKKIELLSAEDAKKLLEQDKVIEAENNLFNTESGAPRFYLVDDRDGDVENLQDAIENLIIGCGCKVVVLDPIHDIIAALPLEQQDEFMAWQKGMVKSHMVTFINVCHTRKTPNSSKAGSVGADLHEEDLMGSSALYKSAAANLMFTRNKEAEDEIEKNTTIMKATKIRWTGKTGIAGRYYYDNEKHRLYDLDDWLKEHRNA